MARTEAITNETLVIDSRDIIARVEYLTTRGEKLTASQDSELRMLNALVAETEEHDLGDWDYGCTLVRDSHFKAYAEVLATETGMISGDEKWPLNCIDWDRAARDLEMDYVAVKFGDVTYWVR